MQMPRLCRSQVFHECDGVRVAEVGRVGVGNIVVMLLLNGRCRGAKLLGKQRDTVLVEGVAEPSGFSYKPVTVLLQSFSGLRTGQQVLDSRQFGVGGRFIQYSAS
jgi:hypothetical protein